MLKCEKQPLTKFAVFVFETLRSAALLRRFVVGSSFHFGFPRDLNSTAFLEVMISSDFVATSCTFYQRVLSISNLNILIQYMFES